MSKEKLLGILNDTFGHSEFRFDQEKIINAVVSGHDALAIMPTGGGKSVCYQVPALYFDGITIVVSPLISLMRDQVLNLQQNGVNACFYNSELNFEEKIEVQNELRSGKTKLVYISPEGLLAESALNFFTSLNVSLIAIDEAHCVSQWGHEFRKDYMRLGLLKDLFSNVPVLALTATADDKTQDDIMMQLKMVEPFKFVSSFDRPNIKYMVYERENEISQLNQFIQSNHKGETGVVYCLSRKKVERVAKELKELGHNTVMYHAGLRPDVKLKAQIDFNKEDDIIVVATIAFGMGIDKPDVRFVAHLDLPKSIEAYYQETGRAGRDGKDSNAWMVYGFQDVIKLSQMLETTEAAEQYKAFARAKLDSMLGLCETLRCRRNFLLGYFGEASSNECGNCDCCLNPPKQFDATIDAQKILSTIFRTGQSFGAGHIIDVLRGSKNNKVIERKHDQLSVYGIGKEKSKNYWNKVLRHLLNAKFIQVKNWEFRSLGLTHKCDEIFKGGSSIYMREHTEKISQQKRTRSEIAVDHDHPELFQVLRELRFELAKESSLAPYMVFNDKALHDMCLILPRDESEFLMVNGVGKSKCDKYASDFLGAIREYSSQN